MGHFLKNFSLFQLFIDEEHSEKEGNLNVEISRQIDII